MLMVEKRKEKRGSSDEQRSTKQPVATREIERGKGMNLARSFMGLYPIEYRMWHYLIPRRVEINCCNDPCVERRAHV
jgi:hypothetical protein